VETIKKYAKSSILSEKSIKVTKKTLVIAGVLAVALLCSG